MGGIFASGPKEVDMDGEEAKLIQSMIHDKCVMVFSKTYCPYCTKAKKCLDALHANYEVLEINKRDDCKRLQDVLQHMTGARTVPRVFIQGKCIGGGNETEALYKSGKLAQMLQECGAL